MRAHSRCAMSGNAAKQSQTLAVELMASTLDSTPEMAERIEALQSPTSTSSMDGRSLVNLSCLPKLSHKDIEVNAFVIASIINFDRDKLIDHPTFMPLVMKSLDDRYGKKLSLQTGVGGRNFWYKWEGDKTRLLWSYFLRQLCRSNTSNNVFVWRLKKLLQERTLKSADEHDVFSEQPHAALVATESVATGASEDPLLALPAFPSPFPLDDESDTDIIGPAALHAPLPVPLPGVPLLSIQPLAATAGSAPVSEVINLLSDDELEDCPPLPSSFFDPLPDSLPVGLKPQKCQRPPAPSDVDTITELLKLQPATNAKEHMSAVQKKAKFLKRPAAVAAAPSGPLLKRPAAVAPASSGPASLMRPRDVEDAAVFEACMDVCKESLLSESRCEVVVHAPQRGIHIYQLKNTITRQAFCQTTDKQFGSQQAAHRAINMLLKISQQGATTNDLQRIKASGALYGVSCGKGAQDN